MISGPRTIPRNSTQIVTLQEQLTECRAFTLDNRFTGQPCSPAHAWAAMATTPRSRLTERDGVYTISVHSNRWYELRADWVDASQP